ncbi:MAG: Gfo/Idh/MocA family oxidoreductase [Clostridiales bacterium]|nr:Gfo/Idh/MocA family oxidoreductase [Clostridiales bacterium]
MERIRYGIIGMGNQGRHYAASLFEAGLCDDAALTAICDVDEKKLAAAGAALPKQAPARFTDHKALIESGLADAVIVAVPHYGHPAISIDALNAGIHVICEKPAGVYAKAVREMNEAAERSGAGFTMMFNQRTNCLYRRMREIIRDGGIGELQRVTWIITDWYRNQFYYDSSSWRATWAGEGGGVLINQCPHQLDLLQWVVGEQPASVRGFCGYGRWHRIETEDEVTAYLTYKNGATGVFVTTTGESPGTNRFEVSGTRGRLVCENGVLQYDKNREDSLAFSAAATTMFARPGCDRIPVETDGKNPQHAGIINNFTAYLLKREPLFVDGREGIRGVELMNAIELSGWLKGEEIALPADEDRYLAELDRHNLTSRLRETKCEAVADMSATFGSAKK